MAVGTSEGNLAVKVLGEYVKDFQKRNPTLRVFSCYLHQDEATPHLHIDFVPYVINWKGKGMDTRVSLKQALKSLGLLWSSIFVTLMANKIGGLQFGIYRNCQISSRVFHTAVAALPLTKANRSDFE